MIFFGKKMGVDYQLVTGCLWHTCAKKAESRVPKRVPILKNAVI